MSLMRLVYSSETVNLSRKDVDQILQTSRANNPKRGISGLLCFNHRYFLQCLEGSRESVNQLYNQILNDPRHQAVQLIEASEIDTREFSDWSMGFVPEIRSTRDIFMRYSAHAEFKPNALRAGAVIKLMRELGEATRKELNSRLSSGESAGDILPQNPQTTVIN